MMNALTVKERLEEAFGEAHFWYQGDSCWVLVRRVHTPRKVYLTYTPGELSRMSGVAVAMEAERIRRLFERNGEG